MNTYLEIAKQAALEAGAFLRKAKNTTSVVEISRRDIKLDVDKQAESIIVKTLPKNASVLCEESGWIGDRSTTYWIVDGLDGTINFHFGIPMAAVSIGYVHESMPNIGVVYDFIHDELFAGGIGLGVTLNGLPVNVSKTDDTGSALLLTALATKGGFDGITLSKFGQGLAKWQKVRMLGSAALSLAYVASGRADACEIAGIMDWDVAAGIALVRAAGGNVSITDRGENVVDILATNGCLHF